MARQEPLWLQHWQTDMATMTEDEQHEYLKQNLNSFAQVSQDGANDDTPDLKDLLLNLARNPKMNIKAHLSRMSEENAQELSLLNTLKNPNSSAVLGRIYLSVIASEYQDIYEASTSKVLFRFPIMLPESSMYEQDARIMTHYLQCMEYNDEELDYAATLQHNLIIGIANILPETKFSWTWSRKKTEEQEAALNQLSEAVDYALFQKGIYEQDALHIGCKVTLKDEVAKTAEGKIVNGMFQHNWFGMDNKILLLKNKTLSETLTVLSHEKAHQLSFYYHRKKDVFSTHAVMHNSGFDALKIFGDNISDEVKHDLYMAHVEERFARKYDSCMKDALIARKNEGLSAVELETIFKDAPQQYAYIQQAITEAAIDIEPRDKPSSLRASSLKL